MDPPAAYIATSYGRIAYRTAGTGSPALLCLHGNSINSRIFRHLFASETITSRHRVLSFDYPGHGESEDAKAPEETYTIPAYAQLGVEVLNKLGIDEVVVLGWSLGGYVGIEMIPLLQTRIKGAMIMGMPFVRLDDPDSGSTIDWRQSPVARDDLTREEMTAMADFVTGPPKENWIAETIIRTDQKARRIMFSGFAEGRTVDQQKLVEESEVPLAIVNGADDVNMDLAHIRSVKYKNLWGGKTFELAGLQHAPFWEDPSVFTPLLRDFLADVAPVLL